VIVDGAHNAASIQSLIRALGAHVAYDSLVLIFGCAQDKDITGMLKQIALGADKVIFTRARNNPRATEPEELWAKFNDLSGKMAQTAASLEEAVRLANRAVSREDLIVVTGSFYFAELAFFGLFLNLFNLGPLGFLDGGHVAVALTRWLWPVGFLIMGVFVYFVHSPAAILSLVVMLPMVLSLFKKRTQQQRDYDRVSLGKRLIRSDIIKPRLREIS
jgi:outer membrane murein-binding lipoprotein Lpp